MLWDVIGLGLACLIVGLWAAEFKRWLDARSQRREATYPLSRIMRRGVGAGLLLAILACIELSHHEPFGPRVRLVFLLMALLLCLLVFVVVLWDFRVLRRELRHEMNYTAAKSVQELRAYVEQKTAEKGNEADPTGNDVDR